MRPSPFLYSRPEDLAGALRALRAGAVPLAGGQSLVQALRLRQASPSAIVDLAAVRELSPAIEVHADAIIIGARVTHCVLAEHRQIAHEYPWLRAAALALGDVQVRNRGTVIGNICWADPRANFAVAMLASGAVVHAIAADAPERPFSIPIDEFFVGFRRHALNGSVVTHLMLPRRAHARGCYREFARQRQDLALVNVCVVRDGAASRVAVGGVHQCPLRLPRVERSLVGQSVSRVAFDSAIDAAFDELVLAPLADPYGEPAYKQHLARVELRRALDTLLTEDDND